MVFALQEVIVNKDLNTQQDALQVHSVLLRDRMRHQTVLHAQTDTTVLVLLIHQLLANVLQVIIAIITQLFQHKILLIKDTMLQQDLLLKLLVQLEHIILS